LRSNTTGEKNIANGRSSLYTNTTGYYNTASGNEALYSNTTGISNTAFGFQSLYSNTTGDYNTALGYGANVSAGDLTNATAIGYGAVASASNTIQLGNSSVTSVVTSGTITANGVTLSSDVRFKKDIETLNGALDKILKLRGTSYNWRVGEIEGRNFTDDAQIGFIAQELREVYPEMVHEDEDGYLSVNYTQVIPVLVEAIKEQQAKTAEQQAKMAKQQKASDARLDAVLVRLKALESSSRSESRNEHLR
jgi:hypothetical protein